MNVEKCMAGLCASPCTRRQKDLYDRRLLRPYKGVVTMDFEDCECAGHIATSLRRTQAGQSDHDLRVDQVYFRPTGAFLISPPLRRATCFRPSGAADEPENLILN